MRRDWEREDRMSREAIGRGNVGLGEEDERRDRERRVEGYTEEEGKDMKKSGTNRERREGIRGEVE